MSRRPTSKPPSLPADRQGHFSEPAARKKTEQRQRHSQSTASRVPLARASQQIYAQALVLFNVLGIPLSSATNLEYNFTSVFSTQSLISLAMIPSLQILILLAMPLPIGHVYNITSSHKHCCWWKVLFGVAAVVATTAELLTYKVHRDYIAVLILRGFVLGGGLGACFRISTLVLATQYRNDGPLVSVQSGFAGFAGALVYTIVARYALRGAAGGEGGGLAHVYSGGVMGATLLAAFLLLVGLKPIEGKVWTKRYKLHLCMPKDFFKDLRGGGMWFVLGYMLVFLGVLVYPVYSVLLLTQAPGLFFPDTATYGVLGMLGLAAVSGSVVANLRSLKKIGAVNTFVAASVLAGAVCLAPVLYPRLYVFVPLAAIYGVALGAILSLHMIVAASFVSKKVEARWEHDMPARVAIVMMLAGLSSFGGIVGAAALIEASEKGGQIVMKVAGACMIGGGVLIGCARMWRWRWRWKAAFYAV